MQKGRLLAILRAILHEAPRVKTRLNLHPPTIVLLQPSPLTGKLLTVIISCGPVVLTTDRTWGRVELILMGTQVRFVPRLLIKLVITLNRRLLQNTTGLLPGMTPLWLS